MTDLPIVVAPVRTDIGREWRFVVVDGQVAAHPPSSIPFLALGSWVLTVGWFGFNVMSAQTLEGVSGLVAINSLTMLVLYGVLGGFLLGVGRLPVPWQALLLSIGVYVALPLLAGCAWLLSRELHKRFEQVQAQFSLLTECARNTLVSIRMIKGCTREKQQIQEFERLSEHYVSSSVRTATYCR